MYIDIHLHHFLINKSHLQVVNLSQEQLALLAKGGHIIECANLTFCAGVHPWWAANYEDQLVEPWKGIGKVSLRLAFSSPQVSMIGEIGLDKIVPINWQTQCRLFSSQLALAAELQKPVIIHCVRAMEEILSYKKNYPSIPMWILHGFRGGKEQALQWINNGFYLSYGDKFNKEALKATPMERLFLETDNSKTTIEEVYQCVAETKEITMSILEQAIELNYAKTEQYR